VKQSLILVTGVIIKLAVIIVKLTLSAISKLTIRAVKLIIMIVGGVIGGLLAAIGVALANEGNGNVIRDLRELLDATGIAVPVNVMADFMGRFFDAIGVGQPADDMDCFVVVFLIGAYFGIGMGPFMVKFKEELILLVKATWDYFWDECNTDEIVVEERKAGVVRIRRKDGAGAVFIGTLVFMVFWWIPKLCIISFICPLIAIYRFFVDP
jgi:hypothetical protein